MDNNGLSTQDQLMLSLRPYLVAGWYEWCIDKDYSPRVLVQVDKNCIVPQGYADADGRIVFNLSASAVIDLLIKETLSFKARFAGESFSISVPIGNVVGVFTADQSMMIPFSYNPSRSEDGPSTLPKRSHLSMVK